MAINPAQAAAIKAETVMSLIGTMLHQVVVADSSIQSRIDAMRSEAISIGYKLSLITDQFIEATPCPTQS